MSRNRQAIIEVGKHRQFPERVWIVVEQPAGEPNRIRFDPTTHEFERTEELSLIDARGFSGGYGWIAGTGVPPDVHYDALLVTLQQLSPGQVVEAVVYGVFLRADGDHKFVTIDLAMTDSGVCDWGDLPSGTRSELLDLYPRVGPGEGWFGAAAARDILDHHPPTHT